ncbi:DUF1934 domain-containing protein [Vaginisenegalia massiliensis]|uniref:DUF1934 domain-containing protein n=1 Tax=Vaginisenegalia massiliensis TaxID=2058294 RepID=UPI000F53D6B9|nr:DUF1934 domain-containing protein [Vaginisenegalia massiliensis]
MRHTTVQIKINQSIVYAHDGTKDRWQWQGTGQLWDLNTYFKLAYQGPHGLQEIKVDKQTPAYATIHQGQTRLAFNIAQTTECLYPTPQGTWELQVVTQDLTWQQEANSGQVRLTYELYLGQEKLGNYDFQLIYED